MTFPLPLNRPHRRRCLRRLQRPGIGVRQMVVASLLVLRAVVPPSSSRPLHHLPRWTNGHPLARDRRESRRVTCRLAHRQTALREYSSWTQSLRHPPGRTVATSEPAWPSHLGPQSLHKVEEALQERADCHCPAALAATLAVLIVHLPWMVAQQAVWPWLVCSRHFTHVGQPHVLSVCHLTRICCVEIRGLALLASGIKADIGWLQGIQPLQEALVVMIGHHSEVIASGRRVVRSAMWG